MPAPDLDLTFLASGASQHVFVRTDDPHDGWVYKTPALLDALLPAPIGWRRAFITRPWKRSLYAACVQAPADAWLRAVATLERSLPPADGGAPVRRGLVRALQHAGSAGGAYADRAWRAHRARCRVRQFRRVCSVLSLLERRGVGDAVLPFRIVERRCTLHVAGIAHAYRGTVLMQRRADYFFEHPVRLASFDWSEGVDAQHRLWRSGIGLADADEVLGPRNWALLDGRLRLADVGSLTTELSVARGALAPAWLDTRQRRMPVQWPECAGEPLDAYFAFVRARVSDDALLRLWGAGRRARPASTEPAR